MSTEWIYHETIHYYTFFVLFCEIGGFSILLVYICKILNGFVQPLQYQMDLIKDLIKVDPKVKPVKSNTYGARLLDFDDECVQLVQKGYYG